MLKRLQEMQAQAPQRKPWRDTARPEQVQPAGDWAVWLVLAGRGWGKTRTGAEWFREQAEHVPLLRIVAPTFADARDTCVEGESGLKRICGADLVQWNRSIGEGEFKSGARFKVFSGSEPDRLRGPQSYADWYDELAAWRYARDAWDMAAMGLRLGQRPRAMVTTTPRPIELLRELLKRADVHVTRGSTYDNAANLAPSFLQRIVERYEGTRLGRQEIAADLLEDMPGALWRREDIDAARVSEAPVMPRRVVGVDPSTTDNKTSDECGIIGAGLGENRDPYVLADRTMRALPGEWAKEAIRLYHEISANAIAVEGNNGGEAWRTIIHMIDPEIPVDIVWASEAKQTRAEPVSMLYEQRRVHHVGTHAALEDEQCTWVPISGAKSPNRIDALVWAITALRKPRGIDLIG